MSASPKRGIKRKRDQAEHTPLDVKASKKAVIDKSAKFRTKLHHAIKEVKKASKIAKAREIQRLVKKLKELRTKDDQEEAIRQTEEQLEALKQFNHEGTASSMLLRRLRKDKHIQANEEAKITLDAQMQQMTPLNSTGLQNSTKALVESRMSSSKILANEITAQVAGLRLLVLPDKETGDLPMIDLNAKKEVGEDAEWESGPVSDTADSFDEAESEQQYLAMNEGESFDSGSESEEESSASEISVSQDLPLAKQRKTVESHMEEEEDYSSFLPSLAVGYTRGDSDASDWSSDDANSVTGGAIAPRKNRRGQRARQAIWEKKYGRNAKHIKKAQEEGNGARKDIPRGGKVSSRYAAKTYSSQRREKGSYASSSRPFKTNQNSNSKPVASGSNTIQTGQKEPSLHPSWEAARKRKAQPMVMPALGKKIVFS